MPRQPRPRNERVQQLLDAAMAVFARRGYAAATVDAVAERAGVAKGTVYQYFKSKEELLFAVFDRWVAQYFAALSARVPATGVSAEEQLRRLAQAAVELAGDVEDLYPLTFEFWAASASLGLRERFLAQFRSVYDLFRDYVAGILRRGIEAGEFSPDVDAEAVAAMFVGALDGFFLQVWFDPQLDAAKTCAGFVEVLIRGLKPRPPARGEEGGSRAEA